MSLLASEKSRAPRERGLGESPRPAKNTSALHRGETSTRWKRQKHLSDCQRKYPNPQMLYLRLFPVLDAALPLVKGRGLPISDRLSLALMRDMRLYQQEGALLSPPSAALGSLWSLVLAWLSSIPTGSGGSSHSTQPGIQAGPAGPRPRAEQSWTQGSSAAGLDFQGRLPAHGIATLPGSKP